MKRKLLVAAVMGLTFGALGDRPLPAASWTPIGFMFAGAPGHKDSLAWPSPDRTVVGLAFCGIGEYGSVYGLELGLYQYARAMHGLQLGGFNGLYSGVGFEFGLVNSIEEGGGLQVGLANIADGTGVTVQAGLYNGPMALTHGVGGAGGLQIGLINNSYRGRHVQIGLFNNAEKPDWCFQIGLFCKRDDFGFLLLGWHW